MAAESIVGGQGLRLCDPVRGGLSRAAPRALTSIQRVIPIVGVGAHHTGVHGANFHGVAASYLVLW